MYNNKNKWFAGLLALLLVLTVGYAMFSETIKINGTAMAKGNFNVQATCTKGFGPEFIDFGLAGSTDEGQGGYENDICTVSGDNVIINTDLLYPSATRFFTLYFTNVGTIPVQHDLSKIVDNSSLCYQVESNDIETCINFSDVPQVKSWYYNFEPVLVKDATGSIVSPEDDLFFEKYYNEDTGTINLESNESLLYYFMLTWNEDDEVQKEKLEINLDVDLNFEQASNE